MQKNSLGNRLNKTGSADHLSGDRGRGETEREQTPAQSPFFVYGTLRKGQGNWARLLAGNTVREIPARLPDHKMYSVGIAYVTDADMHGGEAESRPQVIGELMYVRPELYERVIQELDWLEGYDARRRKESHYLRVVREAVFTDGEGREQRVRAWVYHGGPQALAGLTEANLVPGGDWLAFRSSSAPATTGGGLTKRKGR